MRGAGDGVTRWLVLSDTHGDLGPALEWLASDPRLAPASGLAGIFHLGDRCEDAVRLQSLVRVPVLSVAGNNDAFCRHECPLLLVESLAGHRVLLVHGHRQQVKQGTERLAELAWSMAPPVDAVLFGHTHSPADRTLVRDGRTLRLLNPGCAHRALSASGPRALVLEADPGHPLEAFSLFMR